MEIMTRIRTGSIQSYSATSSLAAQAQTLTAQAAPSTLAAVLPLEGILMDPSDALAGPTSSDRDEMDNVDGTSSQSPSLTHPSTMELMDGVTITIASSNGCINNNNTIGTVDEDGADKCGADKDESDLRAIDFASETTTDHHHHGEPQESVLDFDAAPVDDDNDGHGMMMVDSMAVTEIAINSSSSSSSSHSSSSNSSDSSTSSNSTSSTGNSSGRSEVAPNRHKLEEVNADEEEVDEEVDEEEEDDEEEEEEDEDVHGGPDEEDEQAAAPTAYVEPGVDESPDEKIMHTDDDPLLQETINALMNGTGGIEVVHSPHATSNSATTAGATVSTALAAAVAEVAAEMSNMERATNEELETDRNYECTYCGKLFTRSNTLSYHLKVHTGERPFKCKHCSKAFREQYRLMKHLKTHAKCRNRRMELRGQPYVRVPNGREHLHRRTSTAASLASQALVSGNKGLASTDEDAGTGDSERFFKHYDLPDGAEAMKLEPDISLTEEAISEVPDADAMLTEEVEVMDEGPLSCGIDETPGQPGVTLTDTNDIRHQIIEERIKSLQREVHLVNQNLNRVESKVDGLTRIISLLIEKFEEDVDPTGQTQQQRQAAISQTISTVDGGGASVVPVTSLTVVAAGQQQHHQQPAPSTTPSVPQSPQPKTLLLTSTPTPQQTVYTHVATVGQSAQLQQTIVPLKESRTGNTTQYYQFTEPAIGHSKPSATATSVTVTPSPSPTPPPSAGQTQPQLTLATAGGGGVTMNGNQLLDTFPEIPELPIKTVSDFLDLNDHCTDNEQFLLQMMIRLHQEIHNSQPFQRNIKRMMEALVTYEVLCQFSWSGKSAINGQYTKYVFGNSLGIIDLLTKTLNLGKSAEEAEANQKPIFSAIQSFIKHSRQNMIRDSRKRRDPMRGGGGGGGGSGGADTGGGGMPSDGGGAITFHPNGSDRFLTKLIKSEHASHEQQEIVNPF